MDQITELIVMYIKFCTFCNAGDKTHAYQASGLPLLCTPVL